VSRQVAFVGPPVHGFSNICAKMLELLKGRMPVRVFNRAPKPGRRLPTLCQQLSNPFSYFAVCLQCNNVILYLALSGGYGQLVDLVYVLISKLFRRPVFVHHHSFAYINVPSLLHRCLFALLRRENHIVLSRNMGAALAQLYGLNASNVRIVSNAAYFDGADAVARVEHAGYPPIHVGFLSNITFEKGFVEFFGILQQIERRGVEYRAYIAGPLAPEAHSAFNELLAASNNVEYVGPIYGEVKERFYRQLDIFVFPTKYVNEAEPLVIYEAMRCAVHVIACNRGAIPEMLANGAGLVFESDSIVEQAAMHISRFSADRMALARAQNSSLQQAQRIKESSKLQLENLLCSIQAPT
jgi:glycosyltransferase involved in cell wall biosynthesis